MVGRYDWTISSNDSVFGRYLFDNANLTEPFYSSFPQWSNFDRTRNQFFTLGQKDTFFLEHSDQLGEPGRQPDLSRSA